MRNFSFVSIGLVFVAYGFYIYLHERPRVAHKAITPNSNFASSPSGKKKPTNSAAAPQPQPIALQNSPPAPVAKVNDVWLRGEAIAMNKNFRDVKAAEASETQMIELAKSLTPTDRNFLVSAVINPDRGDNERALSLYLLTLSPSTSGQEFKTIAMMNRPVTTAPVAPHTPEDWNDRTATAFATGALQELQKRSLQDSSLNADLKIIATGAPIPLVARIAKRMVASTDRKPASVSKKKAVKK